jgi:hypothetical protein
MPNPSGGDRGRNSGGQQQQGSMNRFPLDELQKKISAKNCQLKGEIMSIVKNNLSIMIEEYFSRDSWPESEPCILRHSIDQKFKVFFFEIPRKIEHLKMLFFQNKYKKDQFKKGTKVIVCAINSRLYSDSVILADEEAEKLAEISSQPEKKALAPPEVLSAPEVTCSKNFSSRSSNGAGGKPRYKIRSSSPASSKQYITEEWNAGKEKLLLNVSANVSNIANTYFQVRDSCEIMS